MNLGMPLPMRPTDVTRARIAVLGSANMDLVVRQPRRVEAGETMFGTSFETGPGGKGLNQAIAAARAGAAVAFLGAVGGDDFGARLADALGTENIDTSRLRRTDAATGTAHITVTDDGENSIVVVSGANSSGAFDDADRAAVAAASHLVVQFERPLALLREALVFARERGVVTVVTPAPVQPGVDDIIALADVLIPNEHEAAQLSGESDAEAAATALSRAAGTVVVTRGSRGALVARGGQVVLRVDAIAVDAVDTTGAGDTFVGALVAWLANGAPLEQAMDAATAAAAIAVTRRGAAEAAPTAAEISALLASRD